MATLATAAPDRIRRFSGWSAYLSAGLSIIANVFLLVFYAVEAPQYIATGGASSQIFGTLNDITGLVSTAFALPLPVALHQLAPTRHQRLSQLALALGIAGMLIIVIAQALLIAQFISFETNLPYVMIGLALLGMWLLLANHLAHVESVLPSRLARLGEFNGAVFVLLGVFTLLFALVNLLDPSAATRLGTFAQQSPLLIGVFALLAIPGFLAYFFGMPGWLIWLGRRLLATAAVAPAHR